MHPGDSPIRRTIASSAGPRALQAGVPEALEGLGYSIVPASAGRPFFDDSGSRPDLWLVDERQLDEIPNRDADPITPLVALVGARPLELNDPRVVGRASRPAGLLDLYRCFQNALEQNPRSVPRVSTRLAARCIRTDHRWHGAVVSLSETGCLLRSAERIRVGTRLNVQFALPGRGFIDARAHCIRESRCLRESLGFCESDSELGLEFSDTTPAARVSISGFVNEQLAC